MTFAKLFLQGLSQNRFSFLSCGRFLARKESCESSKTLGLLFFPTSFFIFEANHLHEKENWNNKQVARCSLVSPKNVILPIFQKKSA